MSSLAIFADRAGVAKATRCVRTTFGAVIPREAFVAGANSRSGTVAIFATATFTSRNSTVVSGPTFIAGTGVWRGARGICATCLSACGRGTVFAGPTFCAGAGVGRGARRIRATYLNTNGVTLALSTTAESTTAVAATSATAIVAADSVPTAGLTSGFATEPRPLWEGVALLGQA
jgi:hypothetical protein